jgi:hypothetical protein
MEETSGHQRIEKRSIALHKRISEMLEKDPGLLDVARQNLQKGIEIHGDLYVFQEWHRILDRPMDEIRAVLGQPFRKGQVVTSVEPVLRDS